MYNSGDSWDPQDYGDDGYWRDQDSEECEETSDEEQLVEPIPKEVSGVRSLFQHAADAIGARFPFEGVELWSRRLGKGMTDEIQLAIMKASFPVDKELIRHYAYLSREGNDYYALSDLKQGEGRKERRSERLTVKKSLQIGFTLTGTVSVDKKYCDQKQKEVQVVVSFDRRRITSTLCSAHPKCGWCKYVVKLIFYRMDYPHKVEYRLPVSDSIQRLSESEQKQFINILLSRHPLEMLALAQETLDDLFQQQHSQVAIGGDSTTTDVVEVPDLTAGGGLDDDGLWGVEVDDACRLVNSYCHRNTGLFRYLEVQVDVGEYGNTPAASWLSAIQRVRRDNETKRKAVIEEVVRSDQPTNLVSYYKSKGLEEMLNLITDLLRKGEQSAVAVLSAITEQWINNLIGELATEANDLGASGIDECNLDFANELNLSATGVCQHAKNIDLLCTNSPWFVPDQLVVCWRTAVFASALGDDKVENIRSKLLVWGRQLDQAIDAGLRKAEVRSDSEHSSALEYGRRRRIPDRALWRSLLGWNGFEHAAALASQNFRSTISLLLSTSVEFTTSLALRHCFKSNRAEILNTAAYLVLCLLDKGMKNAAKGLARACTTAILSLCVAEPPKEEACCEEEQTGLMNSSVADLFAIISQCHEEMSSSLWGDQSEKSVGMALVILFNAIEAEDWAWSSEKVYNLKPWLRPLVGGSLLQSLMDVPGDPVIMVSSQGMLLGLICVLSCRDTTSPSLMEEVEYQVKKNTIVSKLCDMMAGQNEVLQQFIQLTPVLQQNMACLDAPAAAILLLHIAVLDLSLSQNHSNVGIVVSAVAASLYHQARLQVDMLTSNSSCGFYCYQTQCAASTLMALVVYGRSEAASVIIKCLTDLLLQLLQRQRDVLHISDTKASTGEEDGEQHRQKVKVDNSKLDDYIHDMLNIVKVICGPNVRHYHYYYRNSALAERLGFLKSPVTELMHTDDSYREQTKEQSGFSTVVTSRLHEIQQQSPAMWPAVIELLLILLIINSTYTAEEQRECRERIIQLLEEASDCVGAVTFLETLAGKGWDGALTGEEVLKRFLTRQKFQQSVKCVKKRLTTSQAVISVLGQMFVLGASSASPYHRSELYKTACEYEMIDFLVGAVLSGDCDLKQKGSYSFLFCLAHTAGDKKMILQRFQIGLEAVTRWQQHVGNDSRRHASITAILDSNYSYSGEHIAVIGLLRLVALAVFIDKEPVMAQQKSKSIKLLKVENFLSVFAQNWIDPLFAFILLLEVSRLFHEQWSTVTLLATQDDPETWTCFTMRDILMKQQEFMQGSNAVRLFREVCGACICARDLAHRCKTRLTAFIAHSKEMADNSMAGGGDNSGNDEQLSREVCVRDFIFLEYLCQVYPDDGFDFESFLKGTHEGSRTRMHRHQSVVEQFKGQRNRTIFY